MFPEKWFFKGNQPTGFRGNLDGIKEWLWFKNKFDKDYGFFTSYCYASNGLSFVYERELETYKLDGYVEITFEEFGKFIRNELEEDFPKAIAVNKNILETLFKKLNIT
jgi:hypothetical protein